MNVKKAVSGGGPLVHVCTRDMVSNVKYRMSTLYLKLKQCISPNVYSIYALLVEVILLLDLTCQMMVQRGTIRTKLQPGICPFSALGL